MPYPRIEEIIREMSEEGIHTAYDHVDGVTTLTFTKMTMDGNESVPCFNWNQIFLKRRFTCI